MAGAGVGVGVGADEGTPDDVVGELSGAEVLVDEVLVLVEVASTLPLPTYTPCDETWVSSDAVVEVVGGGELDMDIGTETDMGAVVGPVLLAKELEVGPGMSSSLE